MRKTHLIYVALLLCIAIFWSGCSKNDDGGSEPNQEITMPKEVFQLQIVEAQFSEPLLQEEYNGDLSGVPIKLLRSDVNKMVFYVPGETAMGESTLNIPSLGVQTKLEVKKGVLNGNENSVIKPFLENLNTSRSAIKNEEYANYLAETQKAFEEYYKSLSKEDKDQMALFYQINEKWFKEILDLNPSEGQITMDLKTTFKKALIFSGSVYVFGSSGYLLSLPGTPLEKSIIAVTGVTAGVLAWEYGTELVQEIKIIENITNQIFGKRSTNNILETQSILFVNEEAKNLDFFTGQRKITTADELSTNEGTSTFFNAYGILVNTTEKVNDVIEFINDNLFFSNISRIPIYKIPNSTETQSTALTAEDYNSLKFTVSDANLQLSDLAFENGSVRMKMTVKNSKTVTGKSIITTLNYTYQNQFSTANGSMPIEVRLKEEEFNLAGSWKATEIIKEGTDDETNYYYFKTDDFGISNDAYGEVVKTALTYYNGKLYMKINYNDGDHNTFVFTANDIKQTYFEFVASDEDGYFKIILERL